MIIAFGNSRVDPKLGSAQSCFRSQKDLRSLTFGALDVASDLMSVHESLGCSQCRSPITSTASIVSTTNVGLGQTSIDTVYATHSRLLPHRSRGDPSSLTAITVGLISFPK